MPGGGALPVQLDGTELLIEFIGSGRVAAPRLAQVRDAPDVLAGYFSQIARRDASAGRQRAGAR